MHWIKERKFKAAIGTGADIVFHLRLRSDGMMHYQTGEVGRVSSKPPRINGKFSEYLLEEPQHLPVNEEEFDKYFEDSMKLRKGMETTDEHMG